MATAIKTKLQLTLSNTQIRQISTIISEQNEKSHLGNSVKSKRPIPRAVPNNQTRDNSSASQVSALTEPSQCGRAPNEDPKYSYSTFTSFASSGNVMNSATLEFNAGGQVRAKRVVTVGDSVNHTIESPQQMRPNDQMVETPQTKNGLGTLPTTPTTDSVETLAKVRTETQQNQMVGVTQRKYAKLTRKDVESGSDESDSNESGSDASNLKEGTIEDVGAVDAEMKQCESEGVLKRTNDKICYHLQYDGSFYDTMSESVYFKGSYLATRPNAPRECAGCKKSFNADAKDYIVGSKHQVYACANARDLASECVHALCAPCYLPKAVEYAQTEDTTGRRGRQNRRIGGTNRPAY
jgi:hypothetical protein